MYGINLLCFSAFRIYKKLAKMLYAHMSSFFSPIFPQDFSYCVESIETLKTHAHHVNPSFCVYTILNKLLFFD